jgi:hypothetical protein
VAKRKKKRRDPHAHIDRLVAGSGADPAKAAAAKAEHRDAAGRTAAIPVTAARWLIVSSDGGAAVPRDLVAELLALDPRTTLRSREGETLRAIAAAAESLVAAGAVCPSGTRLVEVLVADGPARQALAPSLDLDALLSGDAPTSTVADRTIRLADAMVERASAHRSGAVDLAARVAPPGAGSHPNDEGVRVLANLARERMPLAANPAPAVVTLEAGWIGAAPMELFMVAAGRLAQGPVADVVGEGLARWLAGWSLGPDPWRQQLLGIVAVDADGLLHEAATRAGSDHPRVLGGVLCELVGMRHPIA